MNTEAEIRDIFGHLKKLIMIHEEMGIDLPPIPAETLHYTEGGITGNQDKKKGADNLTSLEALEPSSVTASGANFIRAETTWSLVRALLMQSLCLWEGPRAGGGHHGKPFVGEAGKLLTKIIENGMGLTREEVYICNVVKCRPPGNRDPERDEIETCLPFLKQQLSIIKPEVICILGRVAGQALLGGDFKITRKRGKWHSYMDIPVMPTYHPAYIIRNPSRERELKGQVWEDIKKIMKHLGLPQSP